MYEVELKVELSLKEKKNLETELQTNNFPFSGATPQTDYYVEAKKSSYGGYDLKRYRNEAGKYIYTEKVWEIVDGEPARQENEYEISKEKFELKIQQYPNAVKIIKNREWYKGSYQGKEISVTLDSVKFNHSMETRYFIEAEIDVKDINIVAETKTSIKNFLMDILHRSEIFDSPGMFMMAFEKR